ncbi:MAG: hypothetical protein JKY92_00655 [Magnetovibrio sp.]|nr:hypothetical protein [Magnetovibrio sp.]
MTASQTQQNTIRTQFQPRLRAEKTTLTAQVGYQPDIQAAVSNLDKAISRLATIKSYVWDLLDFETKSRTADAATIATYTARFDTKIRSINRVADEIVVPPNLIGSTFSTDLSYIINALGDRKSKSYVDLSTGYSIEDASGHIWKKDSYVNSGTLAQYSTLGVATGKSTEVSRSLRLDALNGNAINFTIHPGTAAQESFTGGVLSTTGLNIVDSWIYASLGTTEGRSRAEAALKSALTVIDIQSSAFNGALIRAQFDLGMAEIAAAGANTKISALNQAMLLSLQDVSNASRREKDASDLAITHQKTLLQAYQSLFDTAVMGAKNKAISVSKINNRFNDTTHTGGPLTGRLLSVQA